MVLHGGLLLVRVRVVGGDDMFFRALSANEEIQFRQWARDNYEPGSAIDGAWHPTIQATCAEINRARAVFVADVPDAEEEPES